MTSSYHATKISASQQSFLTETAICTVERWKESMGYGFVPKCNHAQESNTWRFSDIFVALRFLRSRNFATMAT